MSDHCTQHFRISKLTDCFALSLFVVGLMVVPVCEIHADEPSTIPISTKSIDTPTQTITEATQKLLVASQHVAETFSKEGISLKSITAQQLLINELTQLLEQSGQTQSVTNSATKGEPSNQSGGEQGTSTPSQGNASSSTAGQAPVAQASPNIDIGNLSQRENFADAVWGHLPPQERNDLLRTYSETFLPGYEARVQRYFEKLAKLRRRQPNKAVEENKLPISTQR